MFELVRGYNIHLVCLSHKRFKTTENEKEWRIQYDKQLNKKIKLFACDVCVLAGYMLIVNEELRKGHDMINLHPAPLGGPTGSWQEAIWASIDKQSRQSRSNDASGNPELDKGPIVSYCLFSIKVQPFAE